MDGEELKRLGTIRLTAESAQQVYQRFGDALRPYALTPRGSGVLLALLDLGTCHQQLVRTVLGIDRPGMVALVDDLESRRLLHRHRDPADRRAYLLELTTEGRTLAGDVLADLAGRVDDEFTALLDRSVRDRLCRLLVSAIQRHRGASRKTGPSPTTSHRDGDRPDNEGAHP